MLDLKNNKKSINITNSLTAILIAIALNIPLNNALASNIRHDIDRLEYIKFGNNVGKYSAGNKQVKVYKKDGTLSTGDGGGLADKSIVLMPDFSSMSDKGYATPISPSIIVTAAHMVPHYRGETYGKRFYRTDLKLFNNSDSEDDDTRLNNLLEFSLSDTSIAHNNIGYYGDKAPYAGDFASTSVGSDVSIIRNDKMIFDAVPYEFINNDEFKAIKVGDLIARNGTGIFFQPKKAANEGIGGDVLLGYTFMHGHLAYVKRIGQVEGNNISYYLDPIAKTVLDGSSASADSGSAVFIWDKQQQKWKLFGVNSQGISHNNKTVYGYGKTGIGQYADLTKTLAYRRTEIALKAGDQLSFSDGERGKVANLAINGVFKQSFLKHGVKNTFEKRKVQDIHFNNPNGKISLNINGLTDLGASALYFNSDAEITGSGSLILNGFSVGENFTLTSKLTLDADSDWRKVGKGTLKIQTPQANHGSLAIGEGTLELDNNGQAADKIMLATGRAVVRLLKDGQINNNRIYFGVNGGTLDLNGLDFSLSDIYHLDRGANIANLNTTKKSTFSFKPQQNQLNYLGKFNGNLNVVYAPTDNFNWTLLGDSNITGDLTISKGSLTIKADKLIYYTSLKNGGMFPDFTHKDVDSREYRPQTFTANNINLAANTKLLLGRATTLTANNINLGENSSLISTIEGKRHDSTAASIKDNPYLDPNFHNPTINANLNFKPAAQAIFTTSKDFTTILNGSINSPNNATFTVNANASGAGNFIFNNLQPSNWQGNLISSVNNSQFIINNNNHLKLNLTNTPDNFTLNNKANATTELSLNNRAIGNNVIINLANNSVLNLTNNFASGENIINFNATINRLNGISTVNISGQNSSIKFKQNTLAANLNLTNSGLTLNKALTIDGNLTSDNANLDFGEIAATDLSKISEKSYQLNNKLTINGQASGNANVKVNLSDALIDRLKAGDSLSFILYKQGLLNLNTDARLIKQGLEFNFINNKNSYLSSTQTKPQPKPQPKLEIEVGSAMNIPEKVNGEVKVDGTTNLPKATTVVKEVEVGSAVNTPEKVTGEVTVDGTTNLPNPETVVKKIEVGSAVNTPEKVTGEVKTDSTHSDNNNLVLVVKTAPEVEEYLTAIAQTRELLWFDNLEAKSGFRLNYEGAFNREKNLNSEAKANALNLKYTKILNDLDLSVSLKMGEINTKTSSDFNQLNSKVKLTSMLVNAGYSIDNFRVFAGLGLAHAKFNTKSSAATSMRDSFSHTALVAQAGFIFTQSLNSENGIYTSQYAQINYSKLGLGRFKDKNGDNFTISDSVPLQLDAGLKLALRFSQNDLAFTFGVRRNFGKLSLQYSGKDKVERKIKATRPYLALQNTWKITPNLDFFQDFSYSTTNSSRNINTKIGLDFKF